MFVNTEQLDEVEYIYDSEDMLYEDYEIDNDEESIYNDEVIDAELDNEEVEIFEAAQEGQVDHNRAHNERSATSFVWNICKSADQLLCDKKEYQDPC